MTKRTLFAGVVAICALWAGLQGTPARAGDSEGKLPEVADPREYDYTAEEALGRLPEDLGVPVGTTVGDFELQAADGSMVKLSDLVAERPVVLFFYRGGWCPYCNFQVREFQKNHDLFEGVGVGLAGVSVDTQDGILAAKTAYELTYPVLSDSKLQAHEAFKVAIEVGGGMRFLMSMFGIDLEEWSGQEHHKIAVPSIFLVDTTRKVQWAHADLDYQQRPSALHVLGAVKTWQKKTAAAAAPAPEGGAEARPQP